MPRPNTREQIGAILGISSAEWHTAAAEAEAQPLPERAVADPVSPAPTADAPTPEVAALRAAADAETLRLAEIGRELVRLAERVPASLRARVIADDAPGAVPFAVLAAEFAAWRERLPEEAAKLERNLAATPPEDRAAVFAEVMGMVMAARAFEGELARPAAPTDNPAGRSSRRAPPE